MHTEQYRWVRSVSSDFAVSHFAVSHFAIKWVRVRVLVRVRG